MREIRREIECERETGKEGGDKLGHKNEENHVRQTCYDQIYNENTKL